MKGWETNSIKQDLVVTSPSYYLNSHIRRGWFVKDTHPHSETCMVNLDQSIKV